MKRRAIRVGLLGLLGVVILAPAAAAQGSLWKRGHEGQPRGSIYIREAKIRPPIMKNDILMVVVVESSSASTTGSLDARRKLEVELLLDKFVRFSGLHLKPDIKPQPEIEMEANRNMQARAKTDRRENVHLRIAATVVEALPNGNLVIEAKKERRINDEKTTVTLTGIIRTADVDARYSVHSDRIADMKLSYHGKGPVSRNSGWTWLTWLVDHLWPF